MRLIVTRPEPDATRTAKALIRLGHAAILSPMLDIVPLAGARIPRRDFQAVLVTSSNAVRALAGLRDRTQVAGLPLLAVGDRTALEARRAGFAGARSAGGAVDDLVALAMSTLTPGAGPLLYAAGEAPAGDLAGRLGAIGFEVETLIVYRAEARPRLSGVAEAALREENADGVLFYSQRSASAFVHALDSAGLAPLSGRVACFCLAAAIAEEMAGAAQGPVLVAGRPDQISLFQLIEEYAAEHAG